MATDIIVYLKLLIGSLPQFDFLYYRNLSLSVATIDLNLKLYIIHF